MSGMVNLLATLSRTDARHLMEVGLLVAGIGAIVIILGGLFGAIRRASSTAAWVLTLFGAFVIGVGFLLQLISVRYGPP
jgi:FtsH-binding integral membrane protein